jgi:hypothetical protein
MMPETEGGCKLGDEGAVTVYMCVLLRERFVTTLGGGVMRHHGKDIDSCLLG